MPGQNRQVTFEDEFIKAIADALVRPRGKRNNLGYVDVDFRAKSLGRGSDGGEFYEVLASFVEEYRSSGMIRDICQYASHYTAERGDNFPLSEYLVNNVNSIRVGVSRVVPELDEFEIKVSGLNAKLRIGSFFNRFDKRSN